MVETGVSQEASAPVRRNTWARSVSRPVGIGLMVVNAFVLVPVVWLGFGIAVVLLSRLGDRDDPFTFVPQHIRPTLLWVWVASAMLFVVFRRLGHRLSRLNRYRILYLRRFGDTDSTHVVTGAVRRLGGDWRAVTLDDGRVRPVDASAGARAMYAVMKASGHVADAAVRTLKYVVLPLSGFALVLAIIGLTGVAQSLYAVGGIFLVVLVCGLVLAPMMLALYAVVRPPRGVARQRRFIVHTDGDVLTARHALAEAAEVTFGPRLAVVDVEAGDDFLWRRTVLSFARDCDLALVDVSQPTENVLWEIEQLTNREATPMVIVAERTRFAALTHTQTDDVARLRNLIAGRPVLTYSTDRRSARRFVNALRASLMHEVGSRPDRSRSVSTPRWLSTPESRRQLALWATISTLGAVCLAGLTMFSSFLRS